MVYCVVPFCKSNSLKDSVSFHEVPSDLDRREKWTRTLSREGPKKGTLWIPKERDVVCGKHFLPSDYKVGAKYKILKRDAIPSVFDSHPRYLLQKVSVGHQEILKHSGNQENKSFVQPSVSNIVVKSENIQSSCTTEKLHKVPRASTYVNDTSVYIISAANVNEKYLQLKKKIRRMTVTLSKTKKNLNALREEKKKLIRENRSLKKEILRYKTLGK